MLCAFINNLPASRVATPFPTSSERIGGAEVLATVWMGVLALAFPWFCTKLWAQESAPPTSSETKPVRTDFYGDPLPPQALVRMGTVRLRHQPLGVFFFSRDGKTLNSIDGGYSISTWEVATGRKLRSEVLPGIDASWDVQLSADLTTLAIYQKEKSQVLVWDIPNRKEIRRIPLGQLNNNIELLILSRGGQTLGLKDYSSPIRVWSVATGKMAELPKNLLSSLLSPSVFSPDGRIIAWINNDRTIHLWDLVAARELAAIQDSTLRIEFSPDGKTLVSASNNPLGVKLWDVATCKLRATLPWKRRGSPSPFVFSQDGTRLAGEDNDELLIWDLATRNLLHRLPPSDTRFIFSNDGKILASSEGNSIRLWDVATGKPLHRRPGHNHQVVSVAFSPNGKYLVSTSYWEEKLILWEAATGKPIEALPNLGSTYAPRPAFSPDSRYLASARFTDLYIWETGTGKKFREYPIPVKDFGGIYDVPNIRFSSDGKRLTALSAAGDGERFTHFQVTTWDITAGKTVNKRSLFGWLLPDGETMTAAALDRSVVQETSTGRVLMTFPANLGGAFISSADGRFIAPVPFPKLSHPREDDERKTLTVWEVATGKLCLRIDSGRFNSSAYSSNGRLLAAAGRDFIRVWDARTQKEVCRLPRDHWVETLAFSPDGRRLAAGLDDGTILVWDLGEKIDGLATSKTNLNSTDLDKLWQDLACPDAATAFDAIWTLAAAPEKTVTYFRGKLKPAIAVDSKRIQRLIADLDSNQFAVREGATRELEERVLEAEPAFRQALKENPSLEVRRRLEHILARPRPLPSPDILRQVRAIQVLEYIGNSDARALLEILAKGAAGARTTTETIAALQRLKYQR